LFTKAPLAQIDDNIVNATYIASQNETKSNIVSADTGVAAISPLIIDVSIMLSVSK
jgi:hypothetical protein